MSSWRYNFRSWYLITLATFPVITLGDMARALAQICHTSNLPAFKNTTLMLAHAENHSYKELVALMSATLKENV